MKKLYLRFLASCWEKSLAEAITTILVIVVIHTVLANQQCSSETPRVPKYHLMEKCYRSKLGIAAKANYSSVISCQRLAFEKKGKYPT